MAESGDFDAEFILVDTDEDADDMQQDYQIGGVPSVVFIKHGKMVYSFAGADKEKLNAKTAELMKWLE